MKIAVDSFGQTPLHWAVNHNDFNTAKELIEKMSIDEIAICNTSNGYSALHIAAQKGAIRIINLLLEKGKRTLANKVDHYGQTALHWCSFSEKDFPSAEALVAFMEPEDLSIQNIQKYTVLHFAAQGENISLMELLVSKGNPGLASKVDQNGQTALHWAATKGNYRACEILCNHMNSTDINLKSLSGQTARDFAIAQNQSEIITLLTTP